MIKSVLGHFFFMSLYFFKRKLLGIFQKIPDCFGSFRNSLFVSVVSIKVRNTETNRKFCCFCFTKQTETNAKQILFRFVSVRTEKFYFSFRGHPTCHSFLLINLKVMLNRMRKVFFHNTSTRLCWIRIRSSIRTYQQVTCTSIF
jgi:hypothetical protein